MKKKDYIGIIPARYDSTRYPGKPLCMIDGKTMIQRVYEQAVMWSKFDKVYVATDSSTILNKCNDLNIPCLLSVDDHKDCLDRACEVVQYLEQNDIGARQYVIIQGDEPMFNVETLDVDLNRPIINFYTESINDVLDPNAVKVVVSDGGKAIYFSRFSIPHQNGDTSRGKTVPIYKQIGVYVFTGDSLRIYNNIKKSKLEDAEGIGLNRLLEKDFDIYMRYTPHDSISVDTPEDRLKVQEILRNEK